MNIQQQVLSRVEQEVLAVIEADLESFLARDRERWEMNWIHEDRFHSIMHCGTLQIANGYSEFRKNIFESMDVEPDPIGAEIRRENLKIDVQGDIAWATFDQIVSETGSPMAPPNLSHNFRLLERHEGSWRILFHGVWSHPQRDIASPAVEVNGRCGVVWQNPSASREMGQFCGLTISHGTLRATKTAWDKQLRETIARAHRLTTFARYNKAASDDTGSVTFPVVLGEDDHGSMLMCWVKVTDGRVYVLFGETPDLNNQIEVARVIHNLSSSQVRIIRLIARGLELSDIATELGVTINTVKTHLRRAFEKVGVSSQIELLRKLVSFSV